MHAVWHPYRIRRSTQELPEPYGKLLAHEGDMTSRLENHYRTTVGVKILRSSNDGKNYREVLLQTNEPTPRSIEYGAIEIQLGQLPDLKEAVLPGCLLGILNMGRIPYSCSSVDFSKFLQMNPFRIWISGYHHFLAVAIVLKQGRGNDCPNRESYHPPTQPSCLSFSLLQIE